MTATQHLSPFGSIVWATDGSARSCDGLAYVRELCERHGSRLCVVHVARPLGTREAERRIARLKGLTSELRRRGIDASLHVVRGALGSPARHIADVARMADADVVLVTRRRRRTVGGTIGGGIARGLLAGAACPVLVLPPQASDTRTV